MSAEPVPTGEDITPKKDGGVLKVIKREGSGDVTPTAGCNVKVHYVGTLENGDKFDSSRDRNSEFEFLLGRGQVIKGWDVGVTSMKKGELAEFRIRADYGYGEAGSPPKIPANATLIFEVELVSWSAEDISPDRDGSITRNVIVEGTALANPNETSPVVVHAVGSFEGRVFYDKEIEFVLGEGSEVGLPEGVDRALKRFCKGEKSRISLKGSKFTYGPNAPEEYGLPPNAPLEFTIFLKSYEKVPASWELTTDEKLEAAKKAKERGTLFLQQGKLKLAWNKYKRVEDVLEYERNTDEEQKKERDVLITAAYLNLALTGSKMGEHLQVIKYCDKVLEMAPQNVKALFRKATAMMAMNDIKEAQAMFQNIVTIEPSNKAAEQQVLVCKSRIREQLEQDKKRYKKLFAKLSPSEEPVPSVSGVEPPKDVVMEDEVPSTSTGTAAV